MLDMWTGFSTIPEVTKESYGAKDFESLGVIQFMRLPHADKVDVLEFMLKAHNREATDNSLVLLYNKYHAITYNGRV